MPPAIPLYVTRQSTRQRTIGSPGQQGRRSNSQLGSLVVGSSKFNFVMAGCRLACPHSSSQSHAVWSAVLCNQLCCVISRVAQLVTIASGDVMEGHNLL